jgi:hypothetical protein
MLTCKNLVIASVALYLIMNVLKDDKMKLLVGVGAAYMIFGLEGFEDGSAIVANNAVSDDGRNPGPQIDPPFINTGPYDGLCLKTGNKEYWMKSPDQTSLIPNEKLYTYLSSQGPIKMKISDQSALRGPPVDGIKGSDEKMFMLANNVSSPLCCPSTFTTSTGCLCTTQNQRDFVAARGVLDENPANDVSNDEIEV